MGLIGVVSGNNQADARGHSIRDTIGCPPYAELPETINQVPEGIRGSAHQSNHGDLGTLFRMVSGRDKVTYQRADYRSALIEAWHAKEYCGSCQ